MQRAVAAIGGGLVSCALAGCGNHSSPPHPVSLPPNAKSLPVHRSGNFIGAVSANRYGDVEVQITLTHAGRLAAATPLLLPSDRSRSRFLSRQAAPILGREALRAQGARINTVSGATYTSESYAQSLQSAIDRAAAVASAPAAG